MSDWNSLLRQQLAQSEQALEEIEREIQPLFAERQRLNEKIAHIRGLLDLSEQPQAGGQTAPRSRAGDQRPRHFLDDAHDILIEAGPDGLHYWEILEALRNRGVTVPGANPGSNLIAHMRRQPARFAGYPQRGRGYYRAADAGPA